MQMTNAYARVTPCRLPRAMGLGLPRRHMQRYSKPCSRKKRRDQKMIDDSSRSPTTSMVEPWTACPFGAWSHGRHVRFSLLPWSWLLLGPGAFRFRHRRRASEPKKGCLQSPQRKPQVPDGVDRAISSHATTRYITCLMGEHVSTCAHQLGLAGSGKTLAAAGEHYLVPIFCLPTCNCASPSQSCRSVAISHTYSTCTVYSYENIGLLVG